MSDKVLYEFSSRISIVKNLFESTKLQNDALKREAILLEKKLGKLTKERELIENVEKKTIDQYTQTFYSKKNGSNLKFNFFLLT